MANNAVNPRTNATAVPRNTDVPMPSARTLAPNPQSVVNPPSYVPPPLPTEPPPSRPPPPPEPTPGPSNAGPSSGPTDPDGEANTINESLDLIRDILRDSGTRLLNLITNMSMNILSNSERDESTRVPVHVFTGNLRRDFMASSSDSETEHTEVNITRTPNTTFREGQAETSDQRQNTTLAPQISGRMTFEPEPPPEPPARRGLIHIPDTLLFELEQARIRNRARREGLTVSMPNDGFHDRTVTHISLDPLSPSHVRSPSPEYTPSPSTSTAARDEPQPGPSSAPDSTDFNPDMPSTSRGNFWSRGPEIPAAEAICRVQMGVTALQKHTLQLANMWLRGDRTSMRELRTMWEDLRHRIVMLYRESGSRADAPSFYTRSLLERCMILTELTAMSDLSAHRYGRYSRRPVRSGEGNQAARSPDSNQTTRTGDGNQAARTEEANLAARSRNNNPTGRSTTIIQAPRTRDGNQAARFEETTLTARSRNINEPERSTTSNQACKTGDTSQSARTGEIKLATRKGHANQGLRNGPWNQAARNGGSGSSSSNTPSTSNATAGPSTSSGCTNSSRSCRAARAQRILRNKRLVRLQQAYRWRAEDEVRRRERNSPIFRISNLRSRHRCTMMRSAEQNATRHVIRTRAMKVLSVMLNMMMMCLEERGLSQLIINMLKTLKKALALTCFMMMSNRNTSRSATAATAAAATPATPATPAAPATPATPTVSSTDVIRIQNVDHCGPVNVEDSYDPHSLRVVRYNAEPANNRSDAKQTASTSSTQTTPVHRLPTLPNAISHAWSHRVAVQIAAANRNNSSTAKTRRDMYIETRRQKALHRANPTAHPFIRRRFPPVMSHRIPAMRSLPPGWFHHRISPRSPPPGPDAGPSNAPDQAGDPAVPQDRENFIRLAHIRLRTAARNRFRRLQAIRLYTPSSVRDMFALQDFQQENRAEPIRIEDDELEVAFGAPVLRTRAQFHALMAGDGVLPLMQVNDLPPAAEAQAGQAQLLPRIHEYLQPIILAQVNIPFMLPSIKYECITVARLAVAIIHF